MSNHYQINRYMIQSMATDSIYDGNPMNELNLVIHLVSYWSYFHYTLITLIHHFNSYQSVLLVSCILASYPCLPLIYLLIVVNENPKSWFLRVSCTHATSVNENFCIHSLWRYQRVLVFDYPSVGWEDFGSMRSIQWVKCYVYYVFLSILGLKESTGLVVL